MDSSKVAYVAFGEDESLGFNGDDALNRPSRRSFDEPPWRVIDSDIEFKPMFVDGHAPEPEHSIEKSIPDDSLTQSPTTLEDHSSITSENKEDAEWAEVEILPPDSLGITENEVVARIEEAIAEVKNDLTVAHEEEIQAREDALSKMHQEHNRQCEEIREATASEFEEKLQETLEGYRELTAKLKNASSRVSEFFEPLSRLSVHIASQLVRGELSVGPVAIARLVQGCLDAVEDQLSKQDPVLKMHPDDLEMFLSSFSSEPEGVKCVGDDSLARGDVSLQINSSVIDDLITHRLEEITSRIFGSQQGFSDQLFREPLEEAIQEKNGLLEDLTPKVFKHERDQDSDLIADDVVDSEIDEEAVEKTGNPGSSEVFKHERDQDSELIADGVVDSEIAEKAVERTGNLGSSEVFEHERDKDSDLIADDVVDSEIAEKAVERTGNPGSSEVFEHERDKDSDLIIDDVVDSGIDEKAVEKKGNPRASDLVGGIESIDDADHKHVEDGTPDSASIDGA